VVEQAQRLQASELGIATTSSLNAAYDKSAIEWRYAAVGGDCGWYRERARTIGQKYLWRLQALLGTFFPSNLEPMRSADPMIGLSLTRENCGYMYVTVCL
jgi:hypothetical protein